MTLGDSSAVAHLRDSQQWPQVMQQVGKVRAFALDPSPHEIPARLRSLGHPVAIVTNSARACAEAVLQKFDVDYDVLVAFRDTTEHKPDPEPLELALERLGVAADDAYYVGDDQKDIEASYRAGVTSVHAGWGVDDLEAISAQASDILLHEPGPLLVPGRLRRYGYALASKDANQIMLVAMKRADVPGDAENPKPTFDIAHVRRHEFTSRDDLRRRLRTEVEAALRARGWLR